MNYSEIISDFCSRIAWNPTIIINTMDGAKLCGCDYENIDGGRDRDGQGRKSSQELDKASSKLGIVNNLAANHQGANEQGQGHDIGLGIMLATLLRFCIL